MVAAETTPVRLPECLSEAAVGGIEATKHLGEQGEQASRHECGKSIRLLLC